MNSILEPFKLFNDYKHEEVYYTFRSLARYVYENNSFSVKDIKGIIYSNSRLKNQIQNIDISVSDFTIAVTFTDECFADSNKFNKACALVRSIVNTELIKILQNGTYKQITDENKKSIQTGIQYGFTPTDIYTIQNTLKFNL